MARRKEIQRTKKKCDVFSPVIRFVSMAQAPSMNLTQLLDTFQLIDTNKDGTISIDEVILRRVFECNTNF